MDTNQLQSFIARIPVEPLPRLLERLVGTSRVPGSEPYATMILRSGVQVSGWVVGGCRSRTDVALESLLLQGAGPNGQRTEQLTYVAPQDVAAVRFESLETVVEHLAAEVIDPVELEPPPGRLDVLREVEQTKAEVEAAFAGRLTLDVAIVPAVDASGLTLTLLAAWLPVLAKGLRQLASDPQNQAEVLAQIDRVVVVNVAEPAAAREGRSLTLTLPCGAPSRRVPGELVRLIESAL